MLADDEREASVRALEQKVEKRKKAAEQEITKTCRPDPFLLFFVTIVFLERVV